MRVAGWVVRRLLPLTVAALVALAAPSDAAAQSTAPGAPAAPVVAAGDGALAVSWAAPDSPGSAAIAAYDIRYILTSADETDDANWFVVEEIWTGAGSLAYTLIGRSNGAQHDVQVRAVSSVGDGDWSPTTAATPADHGNSRDSATAITPGAPAVGSIADSTDGDFFSFSLSEPSDIFIYTTSYLAGFLATTGELQDSTGSVVATDDGTSLSRPHGQQLFLWGSLGAGDYYVKVSAAAAGTYTLHTELVTESTGLTDAGPLAMGGEASGILATATEDADYFRLEAAEATSVLLRLARTGQVDLRGELLDSAGDEIAAQDDSFLSGSLTPEFFLPLSLEAGVYYLRVSGSPGGDFVVCNEDSPAGARENGDDCSDPLPKPANTGTGPYTVSAEVIPEAGTDFVSARALQRGADRATAGVIESAGDAHYYSLTVSEPTYITIEARSKDLHLEGALYKPDQTATGGVLDTVYVAGGLGFRLEATLASGTSYLTVEARDGSSTGGYIVRVTEDTAYREFIDACTGLTTSVTDPLYGCQWHLDNAGRNAATAGEDINVAAVWSGGNLGADVNIAIVDDGIHAGHVDLTDNVDAVKNHDYTGNGAALTPPHAHGTQLAGIVAARGNALGVRGVAPQAKVYGYNLALDPTLANMADAITREMATTAVSLNGWGLADGPGLDFAGALWEAAVVAGISSGFGGNGVLYVFPAGNGAQLGDHANLSEFANHYGVTAVCAVNDQGVRAGYSERGDNLWVCGPSGDISRNGRQGIATTEPYDRYTRDAGGTGAAAATVAGVAALVRKANPALKWRDVKLILAASARKNDPADQGWSTGALKYGSASERYHFNRSYGFGVVDAGAAVDLAADWNAPTALRTVEAASDANLDLAIPQSATYAESPISVGPGVEFVEYVEVEAVIRHAAFRDVDIELVSPSGAVSRLAEYGASAPALALRGGVRLGTARHLGEDPSGTWTLRVRDGAAANDGVLLSWSLTIHGHGRPTDIPVVTGVNSASTTLTVTWTIDDAAGVTAYDVRHIASTATDKGDSNWTVTDNAWTSTAGGALSYAISGLTNGTSYDVQVRPVRDTTDGSWSETAVGTPAAAAGAAPAITSVRAEEQVLTVAWSAPASPPATVTGYGVRHIRSDAADKATDANWTVLSAATSSASVLTYTITGLTNDVGYDVQVRAVTANGNGAWSATATGLPADFPDLLAQAPVIPLDTPIHGHLTGTTDVDWFRLTIGTATELVVYTTGDADTRGYLRNSDDSTSVSNDDSDHDDATLNFKIIRAVGTGTWYLEVADVSRIGGDYVLRVESRTESTATSNAPTLSLGGAYEAALDSSSDDDYYKLVIGSSTDVILRSSGPTDTKGTLLQSNGTTSVTSNENGQLVEGNFDQKGNTNFLIRRTLSAGTYYLKVEDQNDSTGGYTVHASAALSPGTSRSAAAALTLDVAGAGGIGSATDADFFSFTLTEPRTVGVTAAGSPAADSGDLLIQGELQDAGGAKLRDYARYRPDREVGFRDIHRLEAGTYYIKVTGSTTASREKYVVLVYTFDEHDRRGAKCAGGEPRFTDPLANCQWHLHHPGLPDIDVVDLNLQDVWDSYKGAGVNVAVVDNSMEYTHPDLFPNVNVSLNHSYVRGQTIEQLMVDQYFSITPHGTKVAGIIAAAENDLGVLGVAPKATIYGYNLLRDRTDANEADAMTRNMAVTAVSNNSWGPSDNGKLQAASGVWKQAINRGVTEGNGGKGISYVWAAGNGGAVRRGSRAIDHSNLDEYANYWGVTAVGEHDIFGNKVPTSEAGTNLWVTAPTVWESSPEWWAIRIPNIPADYPRPATTTTDGGYAYMSNFDATSAAAPMAAGVIALMRQANPALTWRDVKLILAETSRKVQPDDPRWVTGAPVYLTPGTRYSHSLENGFGALDAKAAVERAITWTNVPALHTLDSGWQGYSGLDVPNDDGATSLELTFTIEEEIPFIEYIHIPMVMNHDFFRELQIELISPSGIVAVLQSSRVLETDYVLHHWRGNQHNFGDAVHLGESTKGVWTLRITDPSSQTYFDYDNLGVQTTSGRFAGWRLRFYGHGNMPGRPEFPDSDAVTAGTRSLTVNWTAPAVTGATAVTRYDLRYSTDDGASWAVREGIWESGNLTYTLTGLASAAEHMVQVRSVNSDGIGLWSESATGTPTVPPLAAPAIASVTPSDASLGVVWTAPAAALPGEITSYDLRYILTSADETTDSNWTEVSGVWASGPLHYLQASLANASQYDVQVRAVNGSTDPPVNGAWSGTTTGTPAATIDVEVAWVTVATSVAESAGTVTLQASMVTKETGTLPSAFSMPVTVAVSGPTIAPADFSLASDTVTFAFADFSAATIGGQSRHQAVKDIVITIADDDVDELDEVMTVTLDYPGLVLPHQQGGGASVGVTITSDDEGPVRIGWEDAEMRVDESAGTVTLRAFAVTTQDAAPAAGYALRTTVTTIAGTAVRSSSFTPVTRRITLGASDFTQATVEGQQRYRAVVEVILTITDDSEDEPDEELSVVLAPAGASPPGLAGAPAVARVTIADNDHVPVALSWSTPSPILAEADGTLVLMAQVITLVDKAPEGGFTVSLTVASADGTAMQPADYTSVSESFSFSAGDFTPVSVGGQQRYRAARAIPVTVLADTADEPSETFTVTLAYGASASHLTGSSAVANVTLTDSNQADVTIEWDETALTAAEPDTAGGTTTVTLTAVATTMGENAPDPGFGLDFTVVTADGTASQPADYTGLSTSGSFDETDFSSVTVAGNPRYRATMDFPVSVADDTIDEPDETFTATLALADSNIAYLFTGNVTSTVTITDNDHVPVTLSWDDDTIALDEAATTITLTAQVTTETDKAPETGFTVALSMASANGTASAGTDYTAVTDSYSYSPSDFARVQVGTVYRYRASKAFDVAILHDTADEPDETFTLTFAYTGMDLPPHLKGASAVATVTITDNDHVPVELSWDDDAISVNESAGTFTVTAQLTTTRDKAPETGLTVGLSVASANGTAVAPGDYTAVSESFSFTPTDFSAVTVGGAQRYRATRAFTFSVVNDALDEPGEAFTVTLAYTGAAMPHLTGSGKTANVTLVDTTQATVTLAWQASTVTVDEPPASGGTTTATLTAVATTNADQPPDAGFDLDFTVTSSDGTASQPADYAAVSRTESFAVSDFSAVTAGGATRYRATRTFPVTIAHDTADEENETLQVTLALSDPSITYLLLGDAAATVTVTDNDHVPVALSWDNDAVSLDETEASVMLTAQVTTTTDKLPETGFAVELSVASADMGATDGEDYMGVNSNVTLTPADFSAVDVGGQQRYRASRTYDVPTLDDTTDEEDERFTVTMAYAGAPQPHLTGGSARATVTILDDDHVPVTLGWDATQFTVEEPTSPSGSSTLTLTVRAVTVKDKQPDTGFTFDYRARTADDGASAPQDYAALSATGTIARSDFARTSVDGQFRWVAEQEHAIAIAYDTTDEPVENFTATLAYVTPGMPHLLVGDLQATVSITDDIASVADLQTTVTPSASSVMRGDRLTYSWTIENTGPAASTTTALTLVLDPQMVFVAATPAAQCMEDEAVVTCAIGVIEKDASVSGTVVADVDAAAAADIAFSAAAQGDQLERTPGDNEAALATTLVAAPEPVADLRASATRAYVDLRWTTPQDNGSPITSYELERKVGDEAFTAVDEPPPVEETTWRDEDVELNTTYVYRLRAVNEDGSAAWSEEVSATPRVPVVIIGGGGGPSPSIVDFEWNVTRDIEELGGGHDTPSGQWSDGTTLWVLENGDGTDDAVYAYDLKTGERVEGREFALDDTNRAPRGVWSDRTVLWVSDSGRNSLFAHSLESGERLPERDIALAARNRAARGIWSGDETMWVLDGGKDSVFAYDLASGELLAEYELSPANGDPHGIWSDGVTVWVSDHRAKRLFAYRLPAPEGPAAEVAERQDLERVTGEEFPNTVLSRASNNSPRGIWSDGDVMYVADESDGKVYTYNMPDALDARLSSLTLSGVEIGEFDPGTTDYEGTPGDGVTETTVTAEAQPRTKVVIDPPDANEEADGHQAALQDLGEITVTVTSADGSRTKTYRVALGETEQESVPEPWPHCLRGDITVGFSLVVYEGGSVEELVACAESRDVRAVYVLQDGVWNSFILGAPEFVNRSFRELFPDGIPAVTPLVTGSNGPASPYPGSDGTGDGDAPQSSPDCLRGEIATGFSLVVYGGGSVEELEACARSLDTTALYTPNEGEYVSYILAAPEFVNRGFRELFPEGLPAITPLVVKRDGPPGGGSGQDGAAGN